MTPADRKLLQRLNQAMHIHTERIDSLEENYKIIVAAIHKRPERNPWRETARFLTIFLGGSLLGLLLVWILQ